jgi:hypothetical protein
VQLDAAVEEAGLLGRLGADGMRLRGRATDRREGDERQGCSEEKADAQGAEKAQHAGTQGIILIFSHVDEIFQMSFFLSLAILGEFS